ncbi:MAG: HDOD domain-containing protein [Undibacterium sp.]|nr:HDOD domain-containing protein [Undibacterium sp.]
MNSISLNQITENVKNLPTLPAIVMELLNEIDNEDLDTTLLAQKVSNDLALTATTLRYANSAYYSTMIKVTTIQQAISLMGLSTVKKIIMMAALSGCFPENNCRGFSHKAFWRHSNAVGIAAKLIAKRLNFNVDIAFTAGLLHDLGTLVLVTQFPEQYASTIDYRNEHQVSQFEAERKVLGIDHAAVGEALAVEWNFSDTMKNAIAGHHHPEKPGLGFLATIIHVADGIAHVLGTTTTPDSQAVEVSALSWTSLNLDQASMDQLLEDTAEELVKLDSDE